MDLGTLVDDEEDSLSLDDEDGEMWPTTDLSAFSNAIDEHSTSGWRDVLISCWRHELTRRLIGIGIGVVVLLSIVLIAVGGSNVGSTTDSTLLPWMGVTIGILLLVLCSVVGVLVFRSDLIGQGGRL